MEQGEKGRNEGRKGERGARRGGRRLGRRDTKPASVSNVTAAA